MNDKLFIMGGILDGLSDDDIDKFDFMDDTYSVGVDTLPDVQAYGVAVYYNGLIYLVGSYPTTPNIYTFDVEMEELSNLVYTTTQPISAPAALVLGDKLWIFGGEDEFGYAISDVQICDLPSLVKFRLVSFCAIL